MKRCIFIVQEQNGTTRQHQKQNSKILSETFEWWILKRQVLRIERNCKHTSEETSDSPANQTSEGAHQHAFLYSYKKWNQLSPRQTTVAVRRQSDGSDGQAGSLWGFLSNKKNSEHFHAFLSSDIQHSTFHHQPRLAVLLSLQNGKRAACFPFAGHTFLTFHKNIPLHPCNPHGVCIVL